MAKLIHCATDEEFELADGATSIGRSPKCAIHPQGRMVSRLHARVYGSKGEWAIADAGSKIGTFVNGEMLMQPRRLEPGDEIRVGTAVLVFERGKRSSAATAAAGGAVAPGSKRVLVLLLVVVAGLLVRAPMVLTGYSPATWFDLAGVLAAAGLAALRCLRR